MTEVTKETQKESTVETQEPEGVSLGTIRMLIGNQQSGPLLKLLQFDLPLRAAWRLKKIKDSIMAEFQATEDMRRDLIEKYGEKDEKTGNMGISAPDALQKFSDEFNELLGEVVKLDFEAVSVSMLGEVKLNTMELELLESCKIIKMD